MMSELRCGTEPKLICFAVFISMDSAPTQLGWLQWEGCGRREWKQIGIAYGVGMGEEKKCMVLDAGECKQVSRSQFQ